MDTDSLYIALAQKEWEECTRPEMKADWGNESRQNCTNCFLFFVDANWNFFPGSAEISTNNMASENLVFSNSNSGVRNSCVFVVKLTAATTVPLTRWNSAAKHSIGDHWSRVVMTSWKITAKFLMRQCILPVQTEISEQRITLLQPMNKLNEKKIVPLSWKNNRGRQNLHFSNELVTLIVHHH